MTFPLPRADLLAKFPTPNDQSILDDIAKHFLALRKDGASSALVDCFPNRRWPRVSVSVDEATVIVDGMHCATIAEALRKANYVVSEIPSERIDVRF